MAILCLLKERFVRTEYKEDFVVISPVSKHAARSLSL